MVAMSTVPPYHHGDLPAALVAAAARAVAADGPASVSLRALAREVGVSHAAPRHHFGDKRGVLTALAAQGYRRLAGQVSAATASGGFLEAGVAYVRFAVEQPGHFAVMFRPDLVDESDPELAAALDALSAALEHGAAERGAARDPEGDEPSSYGRAGWSIAHGLATLVAAGNFTGPGGRALTGPELADLARDTLRHLAPPDAPSSPA